MSIIYFSVCIYFITKYRKKVFSTLTAGLNFGGHYTSHLEGLKSYVNSTYIGDENDLTYILGRIQCVSLAIGMIIDHIEERNDQTIDFLFNFSDRLNGILFINNALFDYDSTKLAE